MIQRKNKIWSNAKLNLNSSRQDLEIILELIYVFKK